MILLPWRMGNLMIDIYCNTLHWPLHTMPTYTWSWSVRDVESSTGDHVRSRLVRRALICTSSAMAHEPPMPCSSRRRAPTSPGVWRKKCWRSVAGGAMVPPAGLLGFVEVALRLLAAGGGGGGGTGTHTGAETLATGSRRAALGERRAALCGRSSDGGSCNKSGHVRARVARGITDCAHRPEAPARARARLVAPTVGSLYHAISSVSLCVAGAPPSP